MSTLFGSLALSPPRSPRKLEPSNLTSALLGLRARFATKQGSLREAFRDWDTDKSGSIDATELRTALHGLGFSSVTAPDVEGLVASLDDTGSGSIQYDEFVTLVCGSKAEARALTASASQVAAINVPVRPQALANLEGQVYSRAGVMHKRVLGPGEDVAQRHSAVADVARGIGSDSLREAVAVVADDAEAALRRAFSADLTRKPTLELTPLEGGISDLTAAIAVAEGGGGSTPRLIPSPALSPRREELVPIAALPSSERTTVLTARHLLPSRPERVPVPVAPLWWSPPPSDAHDAPMEQLITQASNHIRSATASFSSTAHGGVGGGDLQHLHHVSSSGSGDATVSRFHESSSVSFAPPPQFIPHVFALPVSPLSRTERLEARAREYAPTTSSSPLAPGSGGGGGGGSFTLPGRHRGELGPAVTTSWEHPLSLMATYAAAAAAADAATASAADAVSSPLYSTTTTLQAPMLRTVMPAAMHSSVGPLLEREMMSTCGGGVSLPLPPANSFDRSLHATARIPPRHERVTGPLSSSGAPSYDPYKAQPDTGADTIVIGEVGACREGVTGIHGLPQGLEVLPMRSAASRHIASQVMRLRNTGTDVLLLPLASVTTAVGGGDDGSPSARDARYAARRDGHYSARGRADPAASSPPVSGTTTHPTISEHLKRSRASKLAALGLEAPQHGSDEGDGSSGAAVNPAPSALSLTGSARLIATAMREEGLRTTWLIAPPPTTIADSAPEHPSWHYASAARLHQTRTPVPEQQLVRLHASERSESLRMAQNTSRVAAVDTSVRDFAFTRADAAQRIARVRVEREAYLEGLSARKRREDVLSWPAGGVSA